MSLLSRLQISSYSKLGDEDLADDLGEGSGDNNFWSLPIEDNSEASSMAASSSMNQYASYLGQAGGGVEKKQIKLFILVKDLFMEVLVHTANVRRRQLTLLVLLDIIFSTFLWVVCKMSLAHYSINSLFQSEVLHYTVKTSLFDIVAVTYFRGTLLLIFIHKTKAKTFELLIFMNTILSCFFLFFKIFTYEKLSNNTFVAALYIQSFICTWMELFLFDSRIFQYMRSSTGKGFLKSEQDALLLPTNDSYAISRRLSSRVDTRTDFYSIRDSSSSLADRDDDNQMRAEDLGYIKKGQDILFKAFDTIFSEGWKRETKNEIGDIVDSKVIEDNTKVFRLQAIVNARASNIVRVLYDDVNNQTTWNKTILESRVVKTVDENTDIIYTVSESKGPVSSRDFVVLRHRGNVGQSTVISSASIQTNLVPPVKKYVRGENGPGCFVITPSPHDANKCEFRWLLNSNLKGWLPQKVVDTAFSSVMLEYIAQLRKVVT